jgi:glucose-6-phosphate 1-epimerase
MSQTVNSTDWDIRHQAFGAQVLTANARQPGDAPSIPLFYVSPISAGTTAPVRGGVPVLFPQFNDEGPLPKHGFVRTATWTERPSKNQNQPTVYELEIGPDDHPGWPHSASLRLSVLSGPAKLKIVLQVTNRGQNPFSWTGGLHPYFAVTDLRAARLKGLYKIPVRDRFHPALTVHSGEDVTWNGTLFERLFDTAQPVELIEGSRTLRLSMKGFDQWMVWNPGVAGAKALKDLPETDWPSFVCLEPVIVQRPLQLNPREHFEGALEVELITAL